MKTTSLNKFHYICQIDITSFNLASRNASTALLSMNYGYLSYRRSALIADWLS